MDVIRIAVVSSLPAMRAGLRLMLAGDGELQVTAEAVSLEALVAFPPPLDVLLVTGEAFSAPGMNRWLSQVDPDMGAQGELAVLVLAGNVLRNTVLVAAEASGRQVPGWIHEGVGLLVLAAVCAAIAWVMSRPQKARHV